MNTRDSDKNKLHNMMDTGIQIKTHFLEKIALLNIVAVAIWMIFIHRDYQLRELIFLSIVACMSIFIIALKRQNANELFLQIIMAVLYYMVCVYVVVTGSANGALMFWLCWIPTVIFLATRTSVGVTFNMAVFVTLIACFWTPVYKLIFPYSPLIRTSFPIIYLGQFLIALSAELVRSKTQYAYERANETLHIMATKDNLTGISNLYNFINMSEYRIFGKEKKKYAFISLKLKGGTLLNDLYGYEYFNEMLKNIAQTMQLLIDEDELVARDNSSLFAMLLTYDTKENLMKRLESLSEILIDELGRLSVKIAVGVYEVENPTLDIYHMYHNALLAQNNVAIKENYGCEFYQDNMRKKVELVAEIEDNMKNALENEDFLVYYQPKYDIRKEKYTAAEALVRWRYIDGSIMSPYFFIPVFESNQFVITLDYYIFEHVCMDIRKWLDEGKEPPVISVNMSRLHIYDEEFKTKLCNIADTYKIPKKYLEIEITESALVNEEHKITYILSECQKEGFSISMDDFGSGYSSLNALFNLPINTLKLDRTMFGEIENSKNKDVIFGIINICKRLKIETVAEGIENEEWVRILSDAGCDFIQGYYYARPVPIEEFEKLVFGQEVHHKKRE